MKHARQKNRSPWYFVAGIIWLIINIRVEAGYGTPLERTIDGMVGGVLLLAAIYGALSFFNLFGLGDDPQRRHQQKDRHTR